MKRIVFVIFWMGVFCAQAQEFKSHIQFLTSDSLGGRPAGSVYEQKASRYISTYLVESGCQKVFLQKFPFSKTSAYNIIGQIPGELDSVIIISAHYDHLGSESVKSKEVLKKGVHPGADDNASGVAMLLELAKWGGSEKLKYGLVFVAYSGHEEGLYGSAHFSQSDYFKSLKIRTMLNLDMVGRLDTVSKHMRISGLAMDPKISSFLTNYSSDFLKLRFDDENLNGGDLRAFSTLDFPRLNFTTGIHEDYHKMSDTEDKINYVGMYFIYSLIKDIVITL